MAGWAGEFVLFIIEKFYDNDWILKPKHKVDLMQVEFYFDCSVAWIFDDQRPPPPPGPRLWTLIRMKEISVKKFLWGDFWHRITTFISQEFQESCIGLPSETDDFISQKIRFNGVKSYIDFCDVK